MLSTGEDASRQFEEIGHSIDSRKKASEYEIGILESSSPERALGAMYGKQNLKSIAHLVSLAASHEVGAGNVLIWLLIACSYKSLSSFLALLEQIYAFSFQIKVIDALFFRQQNSSSLFNLIPLLLTILIGLSAMLFMRWSTAGTNT